MSILVMLCPENIIAEPDSPFAGFHILSTSFSSMWATMGWGGWEIDTGIPYQYVIITPMDRSLL